MSERDLYARYPHWPAIKRLLVTVVACAFVLWLCNAFVGCVEVYTKQRAQWLTACEADNNKPYQCLERWEHMQRGGE